MKQFIKTAFCAVLIAGVPFVVPNAVALPAAGQIVCAAASCRSVSGGEALVQDARQRGGEFRNGSRGSQSFDIRGNSRAAIGGGSRGASHYATRGGGNSRYLNRGAPGYARGDVSRHVARGGQRSVKQSDTRRGLSDPRHDRRYSRRHDHRHHRRNRHRDDYYIYFGGGGWPGYYDYPYDYYDYGYNAYSDQTSHVQWCLNRYRSYDPASDTYLGYDGYRHRCNSPFS